VVVALLILVAVGVLVLPGTAGAAPVRVNAVEFTIEQGTNSSGFGWFGQSDFSYTGLANGYPFTPTAGSPFNVSIYLDNYDSVSHTVYSVTAGAPFTFKGSNPALPATIPPGVAGPEGPEGVYLEVTFVAPSTPGANLTLFVTINTIPPQT
jgi:hypothetical protein